MNSLHEASERQGAFPTWRFLLPFVVCIVTAALTMYGFQWAFHTYGGLDARSAGAAGGLAGLFGGVVALFVAVDVFWQNSCAQE